jgi:hypothetical protein
VKRPVAVPSGGNAAEVSVRAAISRASKAPDRACVIVSMGSEHVSGRKLLLAAGHARPSPHEYPHYPTWHSDSPLRLTPGAAIIYLSVQLDTGESSC